MHPIGIRFSALALMVAALTVVGCTMFGPTGQDKVEADTLTGELADYKSWKTPPGWEGFWQSAGHDAEYVKYYANPTAMASFDNPKPGAIIVKEQYNDDKQLKNMTVMKKIDGYDPENKDWYWAIASKSGEVSNGGAMSACISCHQRGDGGGDLLFVND